METAAISKLADRLTPQAVLRTPHMSGGGSVGSAGGEDSNPHTHNALAHCLTRISFLRAQNIVSLHIHIHTPSFAQVASTGALDMETAAISQLADRLRSKRPFAHRSWRRECRERWRGGLEPAHPQRTHSLSDAHMVLTRTKHSTLTHTHTPSFAQVASVGSLDMETAVMSQLADRLTQQAVLRTPHMSGGGMSGLFDSKGTLTPTKLTLTLPRAYTPYAHQ